MFETTVVESRVGHASRTRAMTLPVSVGLHAAIISAAVLANAWSVSMPHASPPQFKPFVMPTQPRIPVQVQPPRPPAQPEPARPPQVRVDTPPAGPVVDPPPTQIPTGTPNLTPGAATGPITGPVRWDWSGQGDTGGGDGEGDAIGQAPSGPFTPGVGGVTKPVIVTRVDPVYPPLLVRMRLKGFAVVECIVEDDGRITSAQTIEATHPLFGDSAREAVLQWKFRPGLLNGEPVPTIFRLTVNFEVRR